jgi:DNA-binding MarR family transcriptional regulator
MPDELLSLDEERRNKYIVAPVGLALARVETGIRNLVKLGQVIPRTVYLVTNPEWTKDPRYQERYVKPLVENMKLYQEMFKIEQVNINVAEFESAFVGLFRLVSDIVWHETDAIVYVDCTSAPKPWFFACRDIVELFNGVKLYYVTRSSKAEYMLNYEDYSEKLTADPGGELWTYPTTLAPETLSQKILPGIVLDQPQTHRHRLLLRELYERENVENPRPISSKDLLKSINKTGNQSPNDAKRALTSVTRILRILADAGWVEVTGNRKKTSRLTEKGRILCRSLFADKPSNQ